MRVVGSAEFTRSVHAVPATTDRRENSWFRASQGVQRAARFEGGAVSEPFALKARRAGECSRVRAQLQHGRRPNANDQGRWCRSGADRASIKVSFQRPACGGVSSEAASEERKRTEHAGQALCPRPRIEHTVAMNPKASRRSNLARARGTPNPSIEGTSTSGLRPLAAAPHVKR